MKLFLSADIEGSAGIARWDEARPENAAYQYFRSQMSQEVAAACRGALASGAQEILVRDAHGPACNIIPDVLPQEALLMRGWGFSPQLMMEGLNGSFDGVIYTGYHSAGGENGNPLAHTISSGKVESITINSQVCSEFMLNTYTAAYHGVPVCFLSGDLQLCENAQIFATGITTVCTNQGLGGSVIAMHPKKAVEVIEEAVAIAVAKLPTLKPIELPLRFEVNLRFKNHQDAYKGSFYPGAYSIDEKTVGFDCENYMDVLRFLLFLIM